jgi:hypothetical protein
MARSVSLNFRTAAFGQESGEVAIALLTITHPSLPSPILLSTDATTRFSTDPLLYGTMSRSQQFLFVFAEVTMPDEQDKQPPAAKLVISNIDRSIIPLARSVSSPPSVKIEIVLASAPDTVEIAIPAMDMVNLQYDANQLTFDLAIDALAFEPFPSGSFDPASFPALFA